MKGVKVIARKNLPATLPLWSTITIYMLLDHVHAPGWAWGAMAMGADSRLAVEILPAISAKRPRATCCRCTGPCRPRHHYCDDCRVLVQRERKVEWNRHVAQTRLKLRGGQPAEGGDQEDETNVGVLPIRLQRTPPERMEEMIAELLRRGRGRDER